MWLLWSPESRLPPSQQSGKRIWSTKVPPPQSGGEDETLLMPWHIQATASVGRGDVAVALPAIIRRPEGKGWMPAESRCEPPR